MLVKKEIQLGWKPGAVSKRLLHKLNNAKKATMPVQTAKTTRKTKKRIEDKPTLIISKVGGDYRVEMQALPQNSDTNLDQCSPLVYKIAREDNEDRVRKLQRKQRRLNKEAVKKIWSDIYRTDACEKTCLRAYKQAIGVLPYDSKNPDCTCYGEEEESLDSSYDEDSSSDCSSLELDWEIHFSPPIASHNR